MTKEEYKSERKKRDLTQAECAELLGIHWTTQARREIGTVRVTREAEISIKSLPLPPATK